MSAATMPLFSVRILGVTVSLTSSRFLAIFLKQLQLENARAAATSTMLNFIKFFIIGKLMCLFLMFASFVCPRFLPVFGNIPSLSAGGNSANIEKLAIMQYSGRKKRRISVRNIHIDSRLVLLVLMALPAFLRGRGVRRALRVRDAGGVPAPHSLRAWEAAPCATA